MSISEWEDVSVQKTNVAHGRFLAELLKGVWAGGHSAG